ncbi:MAG: serine/threonine protein kinase [Eubacterium sp.]|nr:serine/threonine protein kinase [Eubacterium sp.]MCM1217134.1 serine/threonine protein kinase [Lachnospiraceae bacterium]MCM1240344.1 serine/threonine protein kinase [Lachnospiraceae bacterium]
MEKDTGKTAGKRVGFHYHVVRSLGEGAFAQVYLVEDGHGRQYACKVSRAIKMLRKEAEMLSRLYHPLFPAYLGYEESEGTGRLFMEYIPGRSLGQLARRRGGISATQALKIAEELADGMRYLHERQPPILYRDLKPDNIMVCENGHVKVIDLGCACYLDEQGGERVGTPGFAPPEQLSAGQTAGICSDVYGLGRTMQSVMGTCRRRTGMAAGAGSDAGSAFPNGGERHHGGIGIWHRRGRRCCDGERKRRSAERRCRRRLEHMIEESTREDFRQRPQDMISVSDILTGKRKREEGIVCEKSIWESSYKNSCSLPPV